MDLAALQDELLTDPEQLGYADHVEAGRDADLAALLNAANRSGKRPVPKASILRHVVEAARWGALEDLAANASSPYRDAARSAIRAFQPGDFETIDLARPAVAALLDALVAGGALAADDKTAILALADAQVSRAEQLGLGAVGHLDVARALRTPA